MNQYSRQYNHWLRGMVQNSGPSYHILFDLAWSTRYEYYIPNDDNRAEDGLKLRERFEHESSIRLLNLGECRILEFLIALAIRLNEAVYDHTNPDQTAHWFWQLITNLGLDIYNDDAPFEEIHYSINMAFWTLNSRSYAPDGTNGGLFPLRNPSEDQRKVEVWYQMMAYLRENL